MKVAVEKIKINLKKGLRVDKQENLTKIHYIVISYAKERDRDVYKKEKSLKKYKDQ